ncbi:hypothetical protein VaNZ11_016154 [Volvox africanus]|uniref:Uncharacterized protein n=1 Tax=Volvox africanus TaxID=51714 RepID=A0ABQ5SM25_9CHLO|nr:hypothetical protein VaNZ11_016154 [Volvox africanus]
MVLLLVEGRKLQQDNLLCQWDSMYECYRRMGRLVERQTGRPAAMARGGKGPAAVAYRSDNDSAVWQVEGPATHSHNIESLLGSYSPSGPMIHGYKRSYK